jgi:hypothetical protein
LLLLTEIQYIFSLSATFVAGETKDEITMTNSQ